MAGSGDLRMPDRLRTDIYRHLEKLREGFERRHYGKRVGFGEKPALIVIDLAKGWTDDRQLLGSDLDVVVESTCKILDAAREASIPIFFTVIGYGDDDPTGPWEAKRPANRRALALNSRATELDPRLARRPDEKLLVKKYQSCFAGTNLQDMLAGLRVDTLVVTGCSTSHCVHATCMDAARSLRVIVPKEAVGERCELFHLVSLLDIDMTLGDVVSLEEVTSYLRGLAVGQEPKGRSA